MGFVVTFQCVVPSSVFVFGSALPSLTLVLHLRGTLEDLYPVSQAADMSWLVWSVGELVVEDLTNLESTQSCNRTSTGCPTL